MKDSALPYPALARIGVTGEATVDRYLVAQRIYLRGDYRAVYRKGGGVQAWPRTATLSWYQRSLVCCQPSCWKQLVAWERAQMATFASLTLARTILHLSLRTLHYHHI